MRHALLLASVILVATCGGSSGPSPTPDPVAIVREVPLTLGEMPNGWQETPEADDLGKLVGLSEGCDVFDPAVAFPGALATAKSGSFEGLGGQQSQTFAAIYSSDSEAAVAVNDTHAIVDRCSEEFKDALKQAAEDRLKALGISIGFLGHIDVTLSDHNEPPLGDDSAGYRVLVEVNAVVTSQAFTVDFRILRRGAIVAASAYSSFGSLNDGEEQDINGRLLASASGAMPSIIVDQ